MTPTRAYDGALRRPDDAPCPAATRSSPSTTSSCSTACINLVREHTDVPVPDAPWYESDESWFGSPFLVMRRVDGVAPNDLPPYVLAGWLYDATPEQRAGAERASVGVLAGLHALDPERHPLGFLDRPTVRRHRRSTSSSPTSASTTSGRAEGVDLPAGRAPLRLAAREPAGRRQSRPRSPGATPRIGNILYRDFRPVAVLDWEMAALGPAEVDVAWMIWMHRFFEDLARPTTCPGCPTSSSGPGRDRRPTRSSPVASCAHMEWFEVLAATRMAIITIRTTMRTIVFGQAEQPDDPDDVIDFRPAPRADARGHVLRLIGFTMDDYRTIEVTPVTPAIGAEVDGVDLRRAARPTSSAPTCRNALMRHLVLFFREPGPHRGPAARVRVDLRAAGVGEHQQAARRDASLFVTLEDSADSPPQSDRWHTDVAFVAEPPDVAVLNMRDTPAVGGDTMWLSLYAAYDALSPTMQELLADLELELDLGHDEGRDPPHVRPGVPRRGAGEVRDRSATHSCACIRSPAGRALFMCGSYMRGIVGHAPRRERRAARPARVAALDDPEPAVPVAVAASTTSPSGTNAAPTTAASPTTTRPTA